MYHLVFQATRTTYTQSFDSQDVIYVRNKIHITECVSCIADPTL